MSTGMAQNQPMQNGHGHQGGRDPYEAHDNYQTAPTYMKPNPKPVKIKVHVNNDSHQPGKKMVVQTQKMINNFEKFLEQCTDAAKPHFGAARRIYTSRGRHRIQSVEELQADSIYVITGPEAYKRHKKLHASYGKNKANMERNSACMKKLGQYEIQVNTANTTKALFSLRTTF